MTLTEKAANLYEESKSWHFMNSRKKAGYSRRCRDLYAKIDITSTEEDHVQAMLYMDVIRLRCQIINMAR